MGYFFSYINFNNITYFNCTLSSLKTKLQKVRFDAPGNILFGYIGMSVAEDSLWLSKPMLAPGAAAYQTVENFKKGSFKIGDNPGDKGYIKKGISIFKNK